MTYLTVKDRAKTFTLGYLLDARRRGVAICMGCAEEERPMLGQTLCVSCGSFQLRWPEDLIVMNWGSRS